MEKIDLPKIGLSDRNNRNDTNDNFAKIQEAFNSNVSDIDNWNTNVDGKTFPTINDRLNAIEWGLKALGVPIDGSAKDWLGE